jgi:hypothetical protein
LAAGAVPGDDHGVDRVPGGEASRRVGGGRQVRGQSER